MGSTSTPSSSLDWRNDSVFNFYEPPNRPTKEVIFFHDIHWSEYEMPHVDTWMSGSSPSICWPKYWLSSKFPEARIASVRYDSAIWKTDTTGHMDPYRTAENLRQDILAIYTKNCPVFLVGHGVGGLVIKAVIRSMAEKLGCIPDNQASTKDGLNSFLENIKGVFFYDSPFQGIRPNRRLANYHRKFFFQRSPLLKMIKTLNAEACRLNEWFREWRGDRCKTAAISAALPTKVALGHGSYWTFEVVEEASARYDIDQFYTSDKSDHFSICKPPDHINNAFSKLVKFLEYRESFSRNNGPTKQIKDSNISASVVPGNNEPLPERENNVASALTSILNLVANLKPREGAVLNREDLEKIRKFPEMDRRLVEGLEKAGLTQRRVFTHVERWS